MKFFAMILGFLGVFFFDALFGLGSWAVAVAQTAAETVVTQPAAADPGLLEKILEFLKSLETNGVIAGLAILVEMILRFVKTDKPKSILYFVASMVKLLAAVFEKIGEILDKVLPQRTKDL